MVAGKVCRQLEVIKGGSDARFKAARVWCYDCHEFAVCILRHGSHSSHRKDGQSFSSVANRASNGP